MAQGVGARTGTVGGGSTVRTTSDERTTILAIVEGRERVGRGNIGIAVVDPQRAACRLYQFTDTQTYVRTLQLVLLSGPIEILFSSTSLEPRESKLVRTVRNFVGPDIPIVAVARRFFNDTAGLEYVRQYGLEEHHRHLELELAGKYYALAAAAALIKHIEGSQRVLYARRTIKIQYATLDGIMLIDPTSAVNLELTNSLQAGGPAGAQAKKATLYGVLNQTSTAMGARLLRTTILQPSTDPATIVARLDAIDEFMDRDLFGSIEQALGAIAVDIEWLVGQIVQNPAKVDPKTASARIVQVLQLKTCLVPMLQLRNLLASARTPLLVAIRSTLENEVLDSLMDTISRTIDEDAFTDKQMARQRHQKCFAVKADIDGLLDVARKTYTEAVNDIYHLSKRYSEEHAVNLELKLTATVGFVLTLRPEKRGRGDGGPLNLPSIFVNVVRKPSLTTCTTLELIKANDRMNESLQEVYLMSNRVIMQLIEDIRATSLGALYKAAEGLALLDMLIALTNCSVRLNYVRPSFGQTLCVGQGRHPIHEAMSRGHEFVPNDTFCNAASSFHIITGVNMSGKSTYLKQIALLQVMAQMGSFVPADLATFRIADKLFTRLSLDDRIEANASSFLLEMEECAYCLHNVTPTSLVLIDELGRGTSTSDGVGIAFAVCEKLIATSAFVFFATHFSDLTQLDCYANVHNFHLSAPAGTAESTAAAGAREGGTTAGYKLSKGTFDGVTYGIRLAAATGFPATVVEEARAISEQLTARARQVSGSGDSEAVRAELRLRKHRQQLVQQLVDVLNASGTADNVLLREQLRTLRAAAVAAAGATAVA